jgi:hypothetical protein
VKLTAYWLAIVLITARAVSGACPNAAEANSVIVKKQLKTQRVLFMRVPLRLRIVLSLVGVVLILGGGSMREGWFPICP